MRSIHQTIAISIGGIKAVLGKSSLKPSVEDFLILPVQSKASFRLSAYRRKQSRQHVALLSNFEERMSQSLIYTEFRRFKKDNLQLYAIAHFGVDLSLSGLALVHNYSYENEFNMHVNKISFSYERWEPSLALRKRL